MYSDVLSELSRSVCSKFVALISSSIRESGFGLVTSTLHRMGFPAPSSAFFLRSNAAFARSRDPVSLRPEPPEGFLGNKRIHDYHTPFFSSFSIFQFLPFRALARNSARVSSFRFLLDFPRSKSPQRTWSLVERTTKKRGKKKKGRKHEHVAMKRIETKLINIYRCS